MPRRPKSPGCTPALVRRGPHRPPSTSRAAKLPPWTRRPDYTYRGLGAAAAVIGAWAAALWFALCRIDVTGAGAAALIPLLTWLYVGLFITAHDAMHALVAPRHRRLNDAVGRLAAQLYAQFDYDALRVAHAEHHRAPASAQDPDWHDGTHNSAAAWFLTFMLRYMSGAQLARLGCAAVALHTWGGVPVLNLVLFWALPAILSALQLFIVGTYLPHRDVAGVPHIDMHRARSLHLSDAASLLSCFNFGGCHHEHHRHPAVPWWRLHRVRALVQAARGINK